MDAGSLFSEERASLSELGLTGAAFAAPVATGAGIGFGAHDLVLPASVMKIQVGLAVEDLAARGKLDGCEIRALSRDRRTPGPVGISVMRDDVAMSVRDLVVAMLTISDNAATDELIELVGLAQLNGLAGRLGLADTEITGTLAAQLDVIAHDTGFEDYATFAAYDPSEGPWSEQQTRAAIQASAGLDPNRWTHTTAADTVRMLCMIWSDTAGPASACAAIRSAMSRQLTRQRIASGFASPVTVAAKSGGLLGVVRNEAGVVTFPEGDTYAVAIFTRVRADTLALADPAMIDSTIGVIARRLIERLRRRDRVG